MPPTPRTPRTPTRLNPRQPDPAMRATFEGLKAQFDSGLPVELPGCDPAPGGVRIYRGADLYTSEGRQETVRLLVRDKNDGDAEFWVAQASGEAEPGSSEAPAQVGKGQNALSSDDDDDDKMATSRSSSSGPERTTPRRKASKAAAGSSSPRPPRATPPSSPSKARRGTRLDSPMVDPEPDQDSEDEDMPRARRT
ncbi:uncharacterized protein RHOBADRAFT_41533 [Rhodotorula graminis WP1]|uniref:Uncharacterized protein n=1 Tax=Rhodotorula graminis (strain WP1) TaxID=578459 RepID=A0A194SAC4_RHOGW|nr:uncharacterized protein RHOBADRAFT_41533 [Rhodotorula graminis WP1]KPV77539.1 hypothetical protein RHOBADRAFT_41533 [Rhodotorula graminis WP1]